MKISIKVKTNSKIEKIQSSPNGWIVNVKSPAKEGKANEAVVKAVADYLGVSKSMVKIKSGFKSKFKLIEIMEK